MLKKYGFVMSLAVLLTGCGPQIAQTESLPDVMKENAYKTVAKLKEWVVTPPPAQAGPQEVADSYCYHVLQDILCYHQAVPGWENRLVAFQGSHAAPPTPVSMQLLAKTKLDEKAAETSTVVSAKPVFNELPTLPKETEKAPLKSLSVDPEHELLPNPALSPQL